MRFFILGLLGLTSAYGATVSDSIGTVTQTIGVGGNVTKARTAAKTIIDDVYTATAVTQDIFTTVTGSEEAVFDVALFNEVNDNAAVLAAIKTIVCGAEEAECTVAIPARRILSKRDLQSEITVTVTYSVNRTQFDVLEASNSFNHPDFAQALADAVSVGVGNVTVVAVDGTLTIEYLVADAPVGEDPLPASVLASIDTLASEVDSVTAAVVTELGLNSADLSAAVIDRCGGRDCNSRGTCSATTGICTCTDTDYWSVNCELLVSCNNGTKATGLAYCICDYPDYGLHCENDKDCSACF